MDRFLHVIKEILEIRKRVKSVGGLLERFKLKEISFILNHAGSQLCCRFLHFSVEINDQMFNCL